MTKYEVKEKLGEYHTFLKEMESIKKRMDILKAYEVQNDEIITRIKTLTNLYATAVLKTDLALAKALEMIYLLNNIDHDIDVLKRYHIDGLSERTIAHQLHLSVNYIRKKRWRAYEKITNLILKESP